MTAVLAGIGIVAVMLVLQIRPLTGLLMALTLAGSWRVWHATMSPTRDPYGPATHVICGASDPNASTDERIRAARAAVNSPPGFEGCAQLMRVDTAFRCTECGRSFHRRCAERHFVSHGAHRNASRVRE
jgi:hypothetical protein